MGQNNTQEPDVTSLLGNDNTIIDYVAKEEALNILL